MTNKIQIHGKSCMNYDSFMVPKEQFALTVDKADTMNFSQLFQLFQKTSGKFIFASISSVAVYCTTDFGFSLQLVPFPSRSNTHPLTSSIPSDYSAVSCTVANHVTVYIISHNYVRAILPNP